MRQRTVNLIYLVVFVLLLALPTIGRRLYFYALAGDDRAEAPVYEISNVPARVPTPSAGDFADQPEPGEGFILLDRAHSNEFELGEISFLDSRLAARGFELIPFLGGELADELRQVNAYIVIAPLAEFTISEVQDVSNFVRRGGRLLLVGDPTRFLFDFGGEDESFEVNLDTDQIPLNSLANEFDLVFNGDYLYNTTENEGNFRNILLESENLGDHDLTENVSQLAFYGSHSIQIAGEGRALLTGGDLTWSSATDRPGGLVLAALGGDDRVLAVGDVDFFAEPYYTVYDNRRFIAQIADFLTATEREYALVDFPYFFGQELDMVFVGDPELGPDAFDEIIAWQEAFRQIDRQLSLTSETEAGRSAMFVGLYNQAGELTDKLEEANVSLVIDPPIETEEEMAEEEPVDEGADEDEGEGEDSGQEEDADEIELIRRIESSLGNVQMSGSSLILLREAGDAWELIILAASAEGLESVTERLVGMIPVGAGDGLEDCLVQNMLALCPTGVDEEKVEAELETGGLPQPEEMVEEDGEASEEGVEPGEGGEEPEEPEGDGEEEGGGQYLEDYDAYLQGSIEVEESQEASLEAEQSHAWTLDEEAVVVDIILQSGDEMDGVLEMYDQNGEFVSFSDSSGSGEEERMEFIELSEEGRPYTIVVRDWNESGGEYTLTVETVTIESLGAELQGELIYGEPASSTLGEEEIHAWTFTVDEPVEIDLTLQSDENMDGILVLFSPDFLLLDRSDESLAGGEERLEGVLLEEPGEYTVVVGAFGFSGGEYTLLLEQA